MATMPLDRERMGLIAVASVGGFMAGVFLTRYLSSSSNGSPVDQGTEQSETPDAMSLVDTPRSMDSSASFAFHSRASRFSSNENSSIESGVANGDSRSTGDSRLALIVRMDLDMVGVMQLSLTLRSAPPFRDPSVVRICDTHLNNALASVVCWRAGHALCCSRHWPVQEAIQDQSPRVERVGRLPLPPGAAFAAVACFQDLVLSALPDPLTGLGCCICCSIHESVHPSCRRREL